MQCDFCDSYEVATGEVVHQDRDESAIGAFKSPYLNPAGGYKKAKDFLRHLYVEREGDFRISTQRPVFEVEEVAVQCLPKSNCAVTGLNTGRIQLADAAPQYLLRAAIEGIRAAAGVHGVDLPADLVDPTMMMDHTTMYNPSSM